MSRSHEPSRPRRTGALGCADGSVQWRVWAPFSNKVNLVLIDRDQRREITMASEDRGYYFAAKTGIKEGQRYAYRLDGGPERPDPCSLWQPLGLDGPSAVVFPERFPWTDQNWKGIAQSELVFYELHVGTFTLEGTFEAVIPRLASLRELGVTAVEIMPVGQFPGPRDWGYDGVLWYAAQNTYGGPMGLQRFVDACHAAGLAIFLDVVYNHFGPESNHLGEFGPYCTDRYKSPWGDAINYDGAGSDAVRNFVVDNASMWLDEFHIDGLRLDAADTIFDMRPQHILRSIKEAADVVGERRGWPAVVVAESDLNDPRLLYAASHGGFALDAQWMDDFQHAVHASFTGERFGYYADFGEPEQVVKVLNQPYVYAGDFSPFRDRTHGASARGLNSDRFIVFIQNHDQVGNHPSSARLSTLMRSPAKRRLAASLMLLSPYVPLLFMGEEYGEENPFPFFCSFESEELRNAVFAGRTREFHAYDPTAEVADPNAEATFRSAVPSWSWPDGSERAGLRQLYRDLLTARREWPPLRDFKNRSARLISTDDNHTVIELERGTLPEGLVRAYFNLGDRPSPLPADFDQSLTLRFSSEARVYRGDRQSHDDPRKLLPYECMVFGLLGGKVLS